MYLSIIVKYNYKYIYLNLFDQSLLSDKIIIFDTYGGLCNQFYDIQNSINFCLKNNIKFTFRYASFRNDNLVS